ncbi:MAG: hypothetical protein AAGB31_00360, partial [Bdellovibrio sp.]
KMKAQRKPSRTEEAGTKLEGRRLINYRMEHLNKSLGNYRNQLKSAKADTISTHKKVRSAAVSSKTKRATTSSNSAKKNAVAKKASSRASSKMQASANSTKEAKTLTKQAKMRLNRKGSGFDFRERQQSQELQETEVNPSRRNI